MGSAADEEDWRAAQAVWPEVGVTAEELAAFVRDRLGDASAPAAHPDRAARLADLFLACGCARGDEAALAAFERTYFGEVDRIVRRYRGPAAPAPDEVRQLLRHKLFVTRDGALPKIADYRGQGSLRSWFRVTASRLVMNLVVRKGPEVPFEGDALEYLAGASDAPDLEHARRAYKDEFRAAFDQAFGSLADRERSILRYAFCEGLTVEAIGALHGVHKTTAARWVVAAHRKLQEHVRTAIMARLRLGEGEYASVIRALGSGLQLSLDRYLKPAPA